MEFVYVLTEEVSVTVILYTTDITLYHGYHGYGVRL